MKKIFLFCLLIAPLFSFQERDKDKNQAIVFDYMQLLFKKGDFVSLKKLVTENAIYTQAEGLPYGGTYTGFDNWMRMFVEVQRYAELQLVGEPTLLSNSEAAKVIANFSVKFKSKKTGKEITMPIAELFEFSDGKIIHITPYYFDTKTITEFMREEPKQDR
jgi:ketosteroid isomerase-like protein